jgi:Sulfite exporter TauE/SafE
MKSKILINCLVGFAVGIAGGIIGLGGAELRLPYLVGVLRLTAHQAVPVNLAVSLFTIAAAIPARYAALRFDNLAAFASETAAIAVGAVIAAYLGVAWLRRLSLTGGRHADTFIWTALDETGVTVDTMDVITDFNRREGDHIDVRAIDANPIVPRNQDFTFIGTDEFSARGPDPLLHRRHRYVHRPEHGR